MRLLIVSAYYWPLTHPRAHRWTALAEHWAARGWEVHVVCGRQPGYAAEAVVRGVHVHRTGFDSLKEVWRWWRGGAGTPAGRAGRGQRIFEGLYRLLWKSWHFPDDAAIWYFPARRRILRLLAAQPFEAMITVSLPFTGHLLGLAARRRFPALTWLADIGDPFSLQRVAHNNRRLYGAWSRRLERRVLTAADATAVTTEFTRRHYERHFGARAVERMRVVPPLLHPAPAFGPTEGIPPTSADRPVHVAYFGTLYPPIRTPFALLELLDRTLAAHPSWLRRLRVHIYGQVATSLLEPLHRHPLVVLHGPVSREAVRAALAATDVLLNIGNQSAIQLPSKAVEYLASGKPVVNLSYTDPDPFAEFFGSSPLVLNLTIENQKVIEPDFAHWLHFLNDLPPRPDAAALRERVQPFLVEAVASGYEM